jgi:hypothetical protein
VSVLRENLENCIEAFQSLLKAHQSDDALIDAVVKKWENKHHACRALVMSCQMDDFKKGYPDDSGGESSLDDDDNVLTPKV